MDPLSKLRDLIASVGNADRTSRQKHKEIYPGYIEREVLSPKSPIIKQVPPLEVVLYAINNILYPTFITRRLPHLLDLLATVEFYRKRTLASSHEATIWSEYYEVQDEKAVYRLSKEDEAYLKELELDNISMRNIYITLISECCQLDMHLLLVAKPPSLTDFLVRFNEYFPHLNKHYDRKSPRLFWSDLSSEEVVQLSKLGVDCCSRVQEIVNWATDHVGKGFVSGLIHEMAF
ncbi:hypothetical protein C0993_010392 [Termitomyces sp. T159_Od127]|nr:hypothetical protein C0993_010392 [Termitomyces sp. T159_Od127]